MFYLERQQQMSMGHFRVPPGLCIKTRWSAQPLIWKWFFILMQIKLFSTRKVVHMASFWKWGFLELGSGLFIKTEGAQAEDRRVLCICNWKKGVFQMSDILPQYSVPNLFLLFVKPWSAWDWGLEFAIFIFSTLFTPLTVRRHCF